MKLNNEPLSAFAVYQSRAQRSKKKQKTKMKNGNVHEPPKKKMKQHSGLVQVFRESPEFEDSEDEPPQLIEIESQEIKLSKSNAKAKSAKKKHKLIKNEANKLKVQAKLKKKLAEADTVLEKKKKKKKTQYKLAGNGDSPKDNSKYITRPLLKENPASEGKQLLQWLISPISTDMFFEKYWETRPLYVERKNSDYYRHILTSEDLDTMIRTNPLYYTRNLDVVSYENDEKQVFNQEGRAVPSAVWDYYSNGCSIRILNPQSYNQKVHALVSGLQEYFGSMVGVNVYLTPPGSQGFAPHYDDIEAFVVQLEGKKYWKLYHPKDSEVLARDSSPNFKREDIGEPFMEIGLEAGDLLYFPRGVIHEGRTDPDNHSLHITVSVYQHNAYIDLLEHALPMALKKATESDIEFRKGLPLHFLQHLGNVNVDKTSDVRNQVIANVKLLMDKLVDHIDVDHAADQLGRKLMRDSMPPVLSSSEIERSMKGDGDFLRDGKVHNRVEIEMDTMIRLVRYHALRLVIDEDTPRLYYCTENANIYHAEEEQSLDLDYSLIEAVKTLQLMYPRYIQVETLPISDDIMKLQFVADLWEHGLLVTSEPLKLYEFDEDDDDDVVEEIEEESD